jgi:hypothetical protein
VLALQDFAKLSCKQVLIGFACFERGILLSRGKSEMQFDSKLFQPIGSFYADLLQQPIQKVRSLFLYC